MTKKHFAIISNIICTASVSNNNKVLDKETFVHNLCVYFKTQNPLFDVERFVNACKVTE